MGGTGTATGAGARVDVTLKLSQLQNFCKRDPAGYKEDYDAQVRRLESEMGILALQPSTEPSARLVELIQFAAAVSSSSYKGKDSDHIAEMLMNLLLGSSANSSSSDEKKQQQQPSVSSTDVLHVTMPTAALQLHRDVRKACVSALILMRNKGTLEPLKLLELFFRLMAVVPDKGLRELLYKHMVNDIRNLNKKGKRDDKVNRAIQSFLHRVVSQHGQPGGAEETATDIAAKRATDMVCELYRRNVWTDDRTVAILASAVQSTNSTVMCRSMRFFLGIEEKMAQDERMKEDSEWQGKKSVDYHQFSKKTASRKRQTVRALKNKKKAQIKRDGGNTDWMDATPDADEKVETSRKLYPAIELLRDPSGLAEFVLKRLRSTGNYKYEVKLLMINFVTRLVGNHELMLLPLYPFLQKYMGGHQRDVTAILAYTVQACHEQVPPDEVYGILKTIAHNFITERCSEEQMAVGINGARCICARVPAILSLEESQESTGSTAMDIEAFARDLAAYSTHRDRSVSVAAKTWTNFIREVHPGLLQGKDRGLQGSALYRSKTKPLRYGQQNVASGVEGADLLVEYESKKAAHKLKQKQEGEYEGESDDDDGSGKWQEVDDEEEIEEVDDEGEIEEGDDEEGSDEEAPDLVVLDAESKRPAESTIDLSKMSTEERNKLKQEVSSTRVFTSSDFQKMRKLVEREQQAKRDPRETARVKRAIARGEEFQELSDDSGDDSSDEDEIRIAGALNPNDLYALAKRKRVSKAEKLQKIIAGRSEFETKQRAGGSTNIEKKRKKNFQMSKRSADARIKGNGKGSLSKNRTFSEKKNKKSVTDGHDAKKRRRKT
jgi:protein SDA1